MPPLKPGYVHLTDEEEAELAAAIEDDPDDWILTEEELESAVPFSEAHPEQAAFMRRHGFMVTTQTLANMTGPREEVTVKLDPGLVTFFKQHRDGGENLLNDILRSVVFDDELVITRCKEGVIYCRCDDDPVEESSEPSNKSAAKPKADLVSA